MKYYIFNDTIYKLNLHNNKLYFWNFEEKVWKEFKHSKDFVLYNAKEFPSYAIK